MGAKSKDVDVITVADLGLDPNAVGARGARQEVITVDDAPQRERGRMVVDDGSAHEEIIAALETWKLI
jgi:electron transfer flavoprotein beta subunit